MYEDTPRFFSINHNGHLVTYDLDLRPPSTPAPTNHSNPAATSETTHQPTIPILNSFKSIMSRSTEHLPLNATSNHPLGGGKSSKAILTDPYDIGVLLTNPTWTGLSFRRRQDGTLYGLAWAHRELTVRFMYFLLSHRLFICLSCSSMRSSRWRSSSICPLLTSDTLGGWIMIVMRFLLR